MKTNSDFILRNVAGDKILVPSGAASQKYNGLITLNDTAAFIWENLDQVTEVSELIQKVVEEFEVDEETATVDVQGLLREFLLVGMVIDEK